ncbi:penicillin acylase family protein [Nocardiopsis potens]|uniref:penicillin acylase family protein n=1 Tax=Nocardiopsis potens TaxID=1246458 RepID=UPI0005932CF3|nr:penicillin acylase family protein [Nocardiopsis potens]
MARVTPRVKRWIIIPLSVLLSLGLVAAGLGYWTVRRAFPQVDGEMVVPVLDGEATVHRDADGVPQIYADTPADLFRAQGFVDAQDRFWQMHFNRMTTAGRLAELFGEEQVETDVYLRTLGWRHVAEQEYELLEPETRAYFDAYAEGVNAYLAQRETGELGLEFSVLGAMNGGAEVEEWTAVDSLAWLKAMAWDLRGNMEDEIERAGLLAAGIDRERVEELYPAYPEEEHPVIVEDGEVRGGAFEPGEPEEDGGDGADEAQAPAPPEGAAAALERVSDGLGSVPELLGPSSPELGSNSWVVSGEFTESGMPLLANDPHLGAQMPSVWHQTGLHCTEVSAECPFDLTGFGFPGLPGIMIGHNADIAWGFTNLGPDVADLYLERIEGDAAIVDGEEEPLETRTETVAVAGGEDVEFTVRSTRHGPLLSDAEAAADLRAFGENAPVDADGEPVGEAEDASYGVALSWTALEPGGTADAIFAIAAAGDFASFREAARSFEVPAQNLVYADTEGNIGYQAPGVIPVRGEGDGRWPAPGWDSDYDWDGTVPFEELPYAENPASGMIVTANQAAVGSEYPRMLTADWDYGYRAARIRDLLQEAAAEGGLTAEDMVAIQMDAENGAARAVVPHLLEAGAEGTAAEARDLLADWDFQQDAGSAPAAFYNATWNHLLDLLFDELGPDHRIDGGSRAWLVVSRLLEEPGSAWWEGSEASGRDAVLSTAMQRAADELSDRLGPDPADWRWGDLHTFTPVHPSFGTSGIAPVEWLFNGSPVPASGGSSTVNATGWERTEGYAVSTVPSMRMAIDLADFDAARWIDLTGPSGHAFHPQRQNMTEKWAAGETVPMPFTPGAVAEAAEDTLVLRPE